MNILDSNSLSASSEVLKTTKQLKTRHLKEHLKGSTMWNTPQCIF